MPTSLISSRSLWRISTRKSEAVEQRLSKRKSKLTQGFLLHSHSTVLLDYPTPFASASFVEAASTRSVRMKRIPHVLVRVYVYAASAFSSTTPLVFTPIHSNAVHFRFAPFFLSRYSYNNPCRSCACASAGYHDWNTILQKGLVPAALFVRVPSADTQAPRKRSIVQLWRDPWIYPSTLQVMVWQGDVLDPCVPSLQLLPAARMHTQLPT
jgi:hypothetical protein